MKGSIELQIVDVQGRMRSISFLKIEKDHFLKTP
jgi:hypothetical protein